MGYSQEEKERARGNAKDIAAEKLSAFKEKFSSSSGGLAAAIVKKRKQIAIGFFAAFIVCTFLSIFVEANYDLTAYLPPDVTSKKAIDVMEEEFGYPGTARILIEDVTLYEADIYKQQIENVENVDMVSWLSADTHMTQDFLGLDNIEDYYKDGCAVMDITFLEGDTEESTRVALEKIADILGDKGHYGGSAVENKSLKETMDTQITIITIIAVVMIFIILTATTESWAEPFLFLIVMGVAVYINRGTNIVRGEISFISFSVSSILQLAISIDYSIFLLHTFMHEKESAKSKEQAMINAIKHSAVSILSSGMTTFVGFLSLFLMRFTLGNDIGFVLGKAIICSIVTVMFLMPALILAFDGLIAKTQHRVFLPSFKTLSKIIFKLRYIVVGIFIVIAIPTYIMYDSNTNTFGNSALGASKGTVVYDDEEMMDSMFGRSDLYLVMVPNGDRISEKELADELVDLSYVRSCKSLAGMLPYGVPEKILPDSVSGLLRADNYTRMLLYTKTKSESDLAFQTSDEIQAIVKKYYPENAYVVGQTPSTQDLKEICISDYFMVNVLSLIGVALVVAIAFKSIVLPIIVLIPINIAIYVNMTVPYLQGEIFMFSAFVVVCCIQLGATVDYSILLTNNYLDRRKTMPKNKAAVKALQASMLSILTSGAILTVAGYAIYFVVSVEGIKTIGHMLGRGALLSMSFVLIAIPGLLSILDPIIQKEQGLKDRLAQRKAERKEKYNKTHAVQIEKKAQARAERLERIDARLFNRYERKAYRKELKKIRIQHRDLRLQNLAEEKAAKAARMAESEEE